MAKKLLSWAVIAVPLVLAVVFFARNHTTATKLESVAAFRQRIAADRPTYIRFFANT